MPYKNIFLLLGSNLGDRAHNLIQCKSSIESRLGTIIKLSSIYETAPWGKTDQPSFLNQAIQIESDLRPVELLSTILNIEREMGRQRDTKWGARIIDIDIIYFDDQILNSKELTIPHPRIAERKFVLAPLAEISPYFIHPVLMKTNQKLLQDCDDPLAISIYTEGTKA